MDVLGVGVLLVGKSGIGKSETALDLVMRGHRLVADDVIEVRRTAGDMLVGRAPEIIGHHMEIRGLGIINIKDMFGIAAVREDKTHRARDRARALGASPRLHERAGLRRQMYAILDIPVPKLRMPVSPGRNVSTLIEVAARNQLLKVRGHHSAARVPRASGPGPGRSTAPPLTRTRWSST